VDVNICFTFFVCFYYVKDVDVKLHHYECRYFVEKIRLLMSTSIDQLFLVFNLKRMWKSDIEFRVADPVEGNELQKSRSVSPFFWFSTCYGSCCQLGILRMSTSGRANTLVDVDFRRSIFFCF